MSKRLIDVEHRPDKVIKTWAHDDTKVTTETVQDVEPTIREVKRIAQAGGAHEYRYKGEVPHALLEEVVKLEAAHCGVSLGEMFQEVMGGKTDRAKKVWKTLTEGRDFRRLQAQNY